MKRLKILVVIFFILSGTALAGVPKPSSLFLEKAEELQALRYCEEVFSEYEEVISLALENSDDEILSDIAREFFAMSDKNWNGSFDLEGQYFLYVGINLLARVEGLRDKKLGADVLETFESLRVELKKILEAHNMKLPLSEPPANFFEKVGLEKCLE